MPRGLSRGGLKIPLMRVRLIDGIRKTQAAPKCGADEKTDEKTTTAMDASSNSTVAAESAGCMNTFLVVTRRDSGHRSEAIPFLRAVSTSAPQDEAEDQCERDGRGKRRETVAMWMTIGLDEKSCKTG